VKGRRSAALLLLLVVSCAGLPPISPSDPAAGRSRLDPSRVYPHGNWQFLHALRAEMAGGGSLGMLGLTVMSSGARTHRSVLMTLEGFVVFDGEYDGRVTVHRALPPFDSPHFADGLMEDIRLVFLEPEGPVVAAGTLADGAMVRRHRLPDGGSIDVESLPGGDGRIRRYDPSDRLTRTVQTRHGPGDLSGFPQTIELTAAGDQDYRLVMTLLEAVPAET
jgi:hypothetical protein